MPLETPPENRRQNDQWIRDGLKEQRESLTQLREELAAVRKDVADFADNILSAIPNKSPVAHLSAHETLAQDLASRAKEAEEATKLKQEVRSGLIKTAINAAILFFGGLLLLGAQAQFGLWVGKSVPHPVVVEPKKEEAR